MGYTDPKQLLDSSMQTMVTKYQIIVGMIMKRDRANFQKIKTKIYFMSFTKSDFRHLEYMNTYTNIDSNNYFISPLSVGIL